MSFMFLDHNTNITKTDLIAGFVSNKRLLVVLLMLCLTASVAFSGQMPNAPEGYKWYESKHGVGTFLKPKGWYIKEDETKGTKALFITKQKIKKNGVFVTGLTVNQVPDFHKNTGKIPSEYAKGFIAQLIKSNKAIKVFNLPRGKTVMHGAQIQTTGDGLTTRMHYLAFGNDVEDKLYLIWFEAPEITWDDDFRKAAPILNMFILGE